MPSTVLRISNGCIAHISAAVSDAGIMSGSRDLPNVLACRLSYDVSEGTRMPEYHQWSVYEPPGGSVVVSEKDVSFPGTCCSRLACHLWTMRPIHDPVCWPTMHVCIVLDILISTSASRPIIVR